MQIQKCSVISAISAMKFSSCVPAFLSDPASSIVDLQEAGAGRLVHRIGERLPSVIGIVVHILGLLFFMVAFEHGLGWVIVAALIARAGMGLLSPALTVVVQNSVPVARMGSATTSQQFIRQIGAALGVSAFVLAATVGGFRLGLLLMIAVSAGTFACVLALPAHSLHDAHPIDALE